MVNSSRGQTPMRYANSGASPVRSCPGPWQVAGERACRVARNLRWPLYEPLIESELRVLRYLPTHLSAREIAVELYLSPNTVKTHQRHLYQKLGAHSRAQAVERARALGLLRRPSRGSVLVAAVWGASA